MEGSSPGLAVMIDHSRPRDPGFDSRKVYYFLPEIVCLMDIIHLPHKLLRAKAYYYMA